jgi:hypothetical protein
VRSLPVLSATNTVGVWGCLSEVSRPAFRSDPLWDQVADLSVDRFLHRGRHGHRLLRQLDRAVGRRTVSRT